MEFVKLFGALADRTRLRILALLGHNELAVGEIARIIGQSQPRVSRHVRILTDAGLVLRHREGSWVFLRVARAPALQTELMTLLETHRGSDRQMAETFAKDAARLREVHHAREALAAEYFAHIGDGWDELRRLHCPDDRIERTLIEALAGKPPGQMLDIGTGSGRMAELFADNASSIVALDKSFAMLRVARAKLQHLPAEQVQLVQGDFASLPFADGQFDTVMIHQVLHFAQDPALALAEAARVLSPGGRVVVVDFAAHERRELLERHAHARMGFTDEEMMQDFATAGLTPSFSTTLDGGELAIKIWLATNANEGEAA